MFQLDMCSHSDPEYSSFLFILYPLFLPWGKMFYEGCVCLCPFLGPSYNNFAMSYAVAKMSYHLYLKMFMIAYPSRESKMEQLCVLYSFIPVAIDIIDRDNGQ